MESYNIPLGENQRGKEGVKMLFPFQIGFKKLPFTIFREEAEAWKQNLSFLLPLLMFPYLRGMYEGDMGTFRISRFKRMNSNQIVRSLGYILENCDD